MTKEEWLKNSLLLNLGFVPKLFGYRDGDLYNLTQGRLKERTNGVEYYFGLTLKGTERKREDFPRKLVSHKLIKVMHAPFARVRYPLPLMTRITEVRKESFYRWIRLVLLSRADPNPRRRLLSAIQVSSQIGAQKIVIHAADIILAHHPAQLFQKINKVSLKKNIAVCLENTMKRRMKSKFDKAQWEAIHNPVALLQLIREHNLDNCYLTIDTAHLAESGYAVGDMWERIKQSARGDINRAIGHFHLVDYISKDHFDAAVPGTGVIGPDIFRRIIDDLYQLKFTGTISLEVAPLFFYKDRHKLLWNMLKRACPMYKRNMREEENYILEIIEKLL